MTKLYVEGFFPHGTLKPESCRDANCVVSDSTQGCDFDQL